MFSVFITAKDSIQKTANALFYERLKGFLSVFLKMCLLLIFSSPTLNALPRSICHFKMIRARINARDFPKVELIVGEARERLHLEDPQSSALSSILALGDSHDLLPRAPDLRSGSFQSEGEGKSICRT